MEVEIQNQAKNGGDEILLKKALMERDKIKEREMYHISSDSIGPSETTSEAMKKALVEEVNMVVDIVFQAIHRP